MAAAGLQMPTLNDDSKVNKRLWKQTTTDSGRIKYKGVFLESKWVRWVKPNEPNTRFCFDDGRHKYQHGQVVEIEDKEQLRLYLDEGHVIPSAPAVNTVTNRNTNRFLYRFLTSIATPNSSFDENKVYELPAYVGDKYAERGVCEKVREVPQYRAERPEKR